MEGLFCLGEHYDKLGGSRLFAHQFGDGFLVVDDHTEDNVKRVTAVAISLMQYTLLRARKVCKSAISAGDLADVQGCYPEMVRERSRGKGVVLMGTGLLTTCPVMGTALINSYKLSKTETGPLLVVDAAEIGPIVNAGYIVRQKDGNLLIDWVHSESDCIRICKELLGISQSNKRIVEGELKAYINDKDNELPKKWKRNAREYLRLEAQPSWKRTVATILGLDFACYAKNKVLSVFRRWIRMGPL
jgi:hypothetical protein